MDETRLTSTLQSLASGAEVPSSPAAQARVRARAIRRRRHRVAAGSLVVIAAVVGTMAGLHRGGHATSTVGGSREGSAPWLGELSSGPNGATTTPVVVMNASSGAVAGVAYWHRSQLCLAEVHSGHVTMSGCQGRTPSSLPLIENVSPIGGTAWAVPSTVATVRVAHPDGTRRVLTPLTAEGWPYRVVFTTDKVVDLRAFDAAGQQVGEPQMGTDALTLRPVQSTLPCPAIPSSPVPGGYLSDGEGTCYRLGDVEMTLLPQSAEAAYDSTQGYLIQVDLREKDVQHFADLTTRLVNQPAPKNQLAMVLDGKVLSAPTIQAPVTDGTFQITQGPSDHWTRAYAEHLAAQIRG